MAETPLDFADPAEAELGDRYCADGMVIAPAESREALDRLRLLIATIASAWLGRGEVTDPDDFLNRIGDHIAVERLNDFRMAVIAAMNQESWVRPAYFSVARRALFALVGNELAMQRRINLSIQLPGDSSSLLPVHADVWSGDSPFEIVLWIPWVDCHRTKSMYLLPPGPNAELQSRMGEMGRLGAEDLFRRIEPDLHWIDIRYGEVLLFNQNLAHGNRVNQESEARWSSNCRFKAVFTPYADKRLGEFFEPITLRPASRIGLAYELPSGFNE